MIFKSEGELVKKDKHKKTVKKILFIVLCIIVFLLGFLLAGPIISLF